MGKKWFYSIAMGQTSLFWTSLKLILNIYTNEKVRFIYFSIRSHMFA